jgi:hypothetical protein
MISKDQKSTLENLQKMKDATKIICQSAHAILVYIRDIESRPEIRKLIQI